MDFPAKQPEAVALPPGLLQALGLVDIRLLDHFVIADGPPVSLAARGWV